MLQIWSSAPIIGASKNWSWLTILLRLKGAPGGGLLFILGIGKKFIFRFLKFFNCKISSVQVQQHQKSCYTYCLHRDSSSVSFLNKTDAAASAFLLLLNLLDRFFLGSLEHTGFNQGVLSLFLVDKTFLFFFFALVLF